MGIPINQPHVVTVERPDVSRDADTNVANRDYDTPASVFTVECMFQTRTGDQSQDEDGNNFTYDAVLFITDEATNVQPDDLITVAGVAGTTDKFRAIGREPKGGVDGEFSHYEIPLTRATER